MESFVEITGIVMPLDRHNVDTDAIIPKQFLKSIKRTGFGPNLFDEWRYLDHGEPGQDNSNRPLNKDFILNQARYQGATVLLARNNFGCGSSREHAPWALLDYGFRVLVAPSFADIFYNNCFKNGILPIVLDESRVDQLFEQVAAKEAYSLTINLEQCAITAPDGTEFSFEIDSFRRHCLLNGLDDIGLTMQHFSDIAIYEKRRHKEVPWMFSDQG
ncbi:3-isopropylmalate dehydratase small subunit [hydrothermal vent metagenome]|uniref:3-isopropylmalate dehydratase n=1 Tax=hydrothermal vent metagenome TaxID=652676 RepID=A0A3B0YZU7_9ZZZZ